MNSCKNNMGYWENSRVWTWVEKILFKICLLLTHIIYNYELAYLFFPTFPNNNYKKSASKIDVDNKLFRKMTVLNNN